MTKLIRHEGKADGGLDGLRWIPEKSRSRRRAILQNRLDRFVALFSDRIAQKPVGLAVQRRIELDGIRNGLRRLMKERIYLVLHPRRPFVMAVTLLREQNRDHLRRNLR